MPILPTEPDMFPDDLWANGGASPVADSGRRYVVVAVVNHANANAARPALDAIAEWAASDAPALAPGASGEPP